MRVQVPQKLLVIAVVLKLAGFALDLVRRGAKQVGSTGLPRCIILLIVRLIFNGHFIRRSSTKAFVLLLVTHFNHFLNPRGLLLFSSANSELLLWPFWQLVAVLSPTDLLPGQFIELTIFALLIQLLLHVL